jgi:uncharacterized protein YgbK (DUF1537 family)
MRNERKSPEAKARKRSSRHAALSRRAAGWKPRLNLSFPQRLVAYYGDDFTGSTDVMEALERSGLRTVLFLQTPTEKDLKAVPNLRAFGIAGQSRTFSPLEMKRKLPEIFRALASAKPALVHYKICSTFDSSPEVGSIGTAIELGREVLPSSIVPLVVGAPSLGRYVVFGNLFARSGLDSEPTRLDLHPTMSRHPVTPMDESDLRLHLAAQTKLKVGLVDLLRLERSDRDRAFARLAQSGAEIALFDTVNDSHLSAVGELVWNCREQLPLFTVGSSGLEYALTAFWRERGWIQSAETQNGKTHVRWKAAPVTQTVVVSGSCSPVTERQIEWALHNGFDEVSLNSAALIVPGERRREIARVTKCAADILRRGRSPILHTSRGPNDSRAKETRSRLASLEVAPAGSAKIFGAALGTILSAVLKKNRGLRRVAVTGGDTSFFAAHGLGIRALRYLGPMAPGSPLCRAVAPRQPVHQREIVFKGGQVGRDDFFGSLLRGAP